MANFDWYQATIRGADPGEVLGGLLAHFDLSGLEPLTPKNGYQQGRRVRLGGLRICDVMWGGNPGVHVISSSYESRRVGDYLREAYPSHECSRIDACEDWIEPGLFDKLSAVMLSFASSRRLSVNYAGDWHNNEGRSLYLGSPSSPLRLVLYEKGYERMHNGGHAAPRDWVRLEVRWRPKGDARLFSSRITPGECFGLNWVRDLVERIGWDHLPKFTAGHIYRVSDDRRARAALVRQYRHVIDRWVEEVGSPDALGPAIYDFASMLDKPLEVSDV